MHYKDIVLGGNWTGIKNQGSSVFTAQPAITHNTSKSTSGTSTKKCHFVVAITFALIVPNGSDTQRDFASSLTLLTKRYKLIHLATNASAAARNICSPQSVHEEKISNVAAGQQHILLTSTVVRPPPPIRLPLQPTQRVKLSRQ
eukprot:15357387-Ditylum_brightwellii.AAC.1